MESIIKLEHVNFWYNKGKPLEYHALRDVSLEINKGDYVAFFGSSGSGKSTLLYLIAGIEPGQEGKCFINGRDISLLSKQELSIYRQVGVGMIFQQFNLIASMTVIQNVAFPMFFLGASEERAQKEAAELLERVNLTEYANRFPTELSGGQQQRVSIARSLANNPPLIVADEPLGNLDSTNAQAVLKLLKDLNEKDNRTVIMVTHEAWSLQDVSKTFFIKDGMVTGGEMTEKIKKEASEQKEGFAPGMGEGGIKEAGGGVGDGAKEGAQKDSAPAPQTVTDTLYGKMLPELSESKLAARSLSELLLRGYPREEVARFENALGERLEGKLSKENFATMLHTPWKDGGLGLWTSRIERITSRVEGTIEEEREIKDVYKELEEHPEAPLLDDIEKMKTWLLEDYRGKLSDLQNVQLAEIISERLRGIIPTEDFVKILNLPVKKSGLGFSVRTAHRIGEKFEFLLNSFKKGNKSTPPLSIA